ncbi:MAG: hypothetical protein IJP17_00435, partial [Clostridia bacterium]|nr:hypothetical protein [Clostridia bacterium]
MLKLWRKKFPEAALSVIITALAVGVTVFSSEVVHGISEGIQVCISVVIPSLFAMMYLSVFAVECGMAERIGRLLAAPSRWLFGLPGEAGAAVLLSMIGGYPAGAKAVCGLYQRGAISACQARQMANFCFCSGPAFLIGTVGGVTGGMRSGLLLLAVQVVTVPLMGVIMRLVVRGDDCDIIPTRCNAA